MPRINAAKDIGALVAGGATYQTDELRLKAVDNHIEKALTEINSQHQGANGKPAFTKEQIECINHICLQMYCILDPSTKPPTTVIARFSREWWSKSVLGKWKTIGGFLAGLVALTALLDYAKPRLPSMPKLVWPSADGAEQTSQDGKQK